MQHNSPIPPFKLEFTQKQKAYVLERTEEMLNSGDIVLGPYTDEFESKIAELAGVECAVSVNTGTVALHIIFQGLGLAGKEVLVPSNTNYATAAAVKFAGAIPSIYDAGLYPDIRDIRNRLKPETGAIVVVHIGGYISPEIMAIRKLCDEHKIALIEDAAHAHGSISNGQPAGSIGDAAAFSFFLTKAVTTGEGGAVATSNKKLAEYAKQYRQQGRGRDGLTHEIWGDSSRLTEFGAILGLGQLEDFEHDAKYRDQIVRRYAEELSDVGLEFPVLGKESRVSGHKCIAMLPSHLDRQEFKSACKREGLILAREVYEKPLHQQPLFGEYASGDYTMAEEFCSRHICLPLWRTMGEEHISETIRIVKKVFAHLA